MKIALRKFQGGGPMNPQEAPQGAPAPEEQGGAPAPEGGEDPIAQIAQVAIQAIQNQDCEAAMAVCQAFIQMLQQQGQGGAPEEQAPEGEPVYRAGGKLVGRIKK